MGGASLSPAFLLGAPTIDNSDAKGRSHHAAVRGLAFKWIRILYRCWQTRTPYDESTYLQALKRRGSPLLASIMETAKNI